MVRAEVATVVVGMTEVWVEVTVAVQQTIVVAKYEVFADVMVTVGCNEVDVAVRELVVDDVDVITSVDVTEVGSRLVQALMITEVAVVVVVVVLVETDTTV